MIIQTIANGSALCHRCALKAHIKISREYRPRVLQWVSFGEVLVPCGLGICCTKCDNVIS